MTSGRTGTTTRAVLSLGVLRAPGEHPDPSRLVEEDLDVEDVIERWMATSGWTSELLLCWHAVTTGTMAR